MSPADIAALLSIIASEVESIIEGSSEEESGLALVDGQRVVAELVAALLVEHVEDNLSWYQSIRPFEAEPTDAEAASR